MSFIRILYRGSLSSCNYDCHYCPFAKTSNTREELERDEKELERFVDAIETLDQPCGVFFTPWGEALIRQHYRRAMIRLAGFGHVRRVAIQTNLTGDLSDFEHCDPAKIAFWATFHPTQVSELDFLSRCRRLDKTGFRYSVGIVGLKENFASIRRLRAQLPRQVYLWVNAFKREPDYYCDDDVKFLRSVDPYFDFNNKHHPSLGEKCEAGWKSFTVDERGDIRRCHFVDQVLGNLFRDDLSSLLRSRECPNKECGCHIGYVNLTTLNQSSIYGDNLMERIPEDWPNS